MITDDTTIANPPTLTERVCADCEQWTQIAEMVETPARSYVCAACDRRRQKRSAERDQLSFFGQQSLL